MKLIHIITPEQDRILRELYPTTPTAELSKMLKLRIDVIYGYANKHGIAKDKAYSAEVNRKLLKAIEEKSKVNHFKPGQKAWNKGLKVECYSPETCFKKGQLPHNTLADGVITIRTDRAGKPYQFIRLSLGKWEHLHTYTYRTQVGAIPKGHVVSFIDGNTLNTDITNLRLLTREENMLRNTLHRYPPEVVSAMRLIGKLKRTIKKNDNG